MGRLARCFWLGFLGLSWLVVGAVTDVPLVQAEGREEVMTQASSWCQTTINGLNLRTGPSQKYRSRMALRSGTRLTPLAQNASPIDASALWIKVWVPNNRLEGWVSADYVRCYGDVPGSEGASLETYLSPEEAVVYYYSLINRGQYAVAWSALSPSFRRIKNNNDFGGYVKFWRTIRRVIVSPGETLGSDGDAALVLTSMQYYTLNGRIQDDPNFVFELVRDPYHGGWLIDRTRRFGY